MLFRKMYLVNWVVVLIAGACTSRPASPLPPTSEATPALPTTTPVELSPTLEPSATVESLATATLTPWPTSLPRDASWVTYTSAALGLSLQHPADWQIADGEGRGRTGYFRLGVRPFFARTYTACMLEANRAKPNRYGAHPLMLDVATGLIGQGCVIWPSEDQPAEADHQATLLLHYPGSVRPDTLLILQADRDHLLAIAESLQFTAPDTPTPSSSPGDASGCQAPPTPLAPLQLPNGLTVEEFPIAPEACDPLDNFDVFRAAIPAAAQRHILAWPTLSTRRRVEEVNRTLSPFGYRLELESETPYPTFAVYRGAVLLGQSLSLLWPVSVSGDGADFALLMQDTDNTPLGTILIRRDSFQALDWRSIDTSFPVPPVYAGNALVSAWFDQTQHLQPGGRPTQLLVRRGDEVVDTLATRGYAVDSALKGLWAWDDQWVVEVDGVMVRDGEILNDVLGYDEMFASQLLNGKPFYFFRQGARVGVFYAGQAVPGLFDDVMHYYACCDPSYYDVRGAEQGISFFARRQGVWSYVVVQAAP